MSNADELRKLKDLLDEGAITPDEYVSQKEVLLQSSSGYVPKPVTATPPKKKKPGCLRIFAIILVALGIVVAYVISQESKMLSPAPTPSDSPESLLVFDALQYAPNNGSGTSESELIANLGEPDSVEDWSYKTATLTYPIRTLYYGNYEYSFNNGSLHRVTILEEFQFDSKDDFLRMFGLQKYSDTEINDTGVFYRAYNCGIHDIWIGYKDGRINIVHISYSSLF